MNTPDAPATALLHETLSQSFRERLLPRDRVDWLLAIPLTVWIATLFCGIPAVIAYACFRWGGFSQINAYFLSVIVGLGVLLDVCLLVGLPAVRTVTLDRDGLLLRRYSGWHKRVPWDRLRRVTEAPRAEVFRRVWLWPGVPPRGSVLCGTSLHQFQIEWEGGEYYFCPTDPVDFMWEIRQRRPKLLEGTACGVKTTATSTASPR